VFGHFMLPNTIIVSPNVAFYVAGLAMVISLGLFLRVDRKHAVLNRPRS
jgi:hypothetical protein